jgi:hypothetical protein
MKRCRTLLRTVFLILCFTRTSLHTFKTTFQEDIILLYFLVCLAGLGLGVLVTILAQTRTAARLASRINEMLPKLKKAMGVGIWLFIGGLVIIEIKSNWTSFTQLVDFTSWDSLFITLLHNRAIFHVVTFGSFFALIALAHFIIKFGFINWGEFELFGLKARRGVQEAKKEANSEIIQNREIEWIRIRILEAVSQEGTYDIVANFIDDEGLDGQALLHEVAGYVKYHYSNNSLNVNVNVGFVEVVDNQIETTAIAHLNNCIRDALQITIQDSIPRILTQNGSSVVVSPIIFGEYRELYYLLYLHSSNSEKLEFDKRDEAMLMIIKSSLNNFFVRAWSEQREEAVI